jgi:dimethylhistidine N-methyltransferase
MSPSNLPQTSSCQDGDRLTVTHLSQTSPNPSPAGADVREGLQQIPKTLPAQYFYDDRGSQLFEQICDLPEYYPTRTEASILQTAAPEIASLTGNSELVELGSGSSTKTRLLLDAYCQSLTPERSALIYRAIDVSGGMLQQSAQTLLNDYPPLHVQGLVGTYEQALDHLPPTEADSRLLLFLGSTLGNLKPEACQQFLQRVSQALHPGEYFLLGIDLAKPKSILEAAYNDAQGVTAAFNLNMLAHLNRRFEGNFKVDQFEHWAFFNEKDSQIEMHLRSQVSQSVTLRQLDLTLELAQGETIQTEISRKFKYPDIVESLNQVKLETVHCWSDPQNWFAVLLTRRRP